MTYKDQLNHPLWKDKSAEIIDLDGNKCRCCGATENLTVHHKRYARDGFLWDVPDDWLETLCWPCHALRHQLERDYRMLDTAAFLSLAAERQARDAVRGGLIRAPGCQCDHKVCRCVWDAWCAKTDEPDLDRSEAEDELMGEVVRLKKQVEELEDGEDDEYWDRVKTDPFLFEHWQ